MSPTTPQESSLVTNQGPLLLPASQLPTGPVPSQARAHSVLAHYVRLHRCLVTWATDERWLARPPHLWLTGPRGSGKSWVACDVAAQSGLPWIRADLSRYSIAGQPGRNLELLVQELANKPSGPAFNKVSPGLIVIEGIDRELDPSASGDRARSLQSELVSLLEGLEIRFRTQGQGDFVNSRRLLFLLTFTTETSTSRGTLGFGVATPPSPGTPSETSTRRLREAGVHPSLLGIGLLHLPELTLGDLEALVLREVGALAGIRRLFAEEGVSLELANDARGWISREALALERGGHGLLQALSGVAARLAEVLTDLPQNVATLRLSADFLEGRRPPDWVAGIRKPVVALKPADAGFLTPHPDFPRESLPHRPTRPANTGASSQGRLANLADLNRWIQ